MGFAFYLVWLRFMAIPSTTIELYRKGVVQSTKILEAFINKNTSAQSILGENWASNKKFPVDPFLVPRPSNYAGKKGIKTKIYFLNGRRLEIVRIQLFHQK